MSRRAANGSELSSAPLRSWLTRKVQALHRTLPATGRASGTFWAACRSEEGLEADLCAIGHALFATAGQPSNEDVPLQGCRCPAAAKPFGQGREAHEDLWLLWAAQEAHGHLLWHPARVNVHQAQCAISFMFRPRSLRRAQEHRCISAHRSEFPSRLLQPFPEAHKSCAAVADTEGLILPLKCSVIMAPS